MYIQFYILKKAEELMLMIIKKWIYCEIFDEFSQIERSSEEEWRDVLLLNFIRSLVLRISLFHLFFFST